MKILVFFSIAFLLSYSINAINPLAKTYEKNETTELEINDILNEIMDVNENQLLSQLHKKNKIIILDEVFNKIREEYIDDIENINSRSILVPIIYRSEFIIKVHNVSYYMLEKKIS